MVSTAHRGNYGKEQSSRTSMLLNPSMKVNIDAEAVETELNNLLLEKASTFMMGNTVHRYDHLAKIFFLARPVNQ